MLIDEVEFAGFNQQIADTITIEHKGIKAFIREGTSDRFVVKEVMGGEYRKLNIQEDDVVLDIGANIGIFALYALQKGAKFVHSYEAEYQNSIIAAYNVKLNGWQNAAISQGAVIGNDDETRDFSINVKKNKGAHSLIAKRGRNTTTVPCVNINNLLDVIKPAVVKMDIEGGEWECLRAVKSFDGIRELIFEFHHAHLDDIKTHEKYNFIVDLMKQHFKTVEYREDTKGAWVCTVYCSVE